MTEWPGAPVQAAWPGTPAKQPPPTSWPGAPAKAAAAKPAAADKPTTSAKAAPDPVSGFLADVKGETATRYHEAAENYRARNKNATDLDSLNPVRAVQDVGDLASMAVSPLGGVGDAIGRRVDPTFGKPGSKGGEQKKYGDLAEMVTPWPGEKLLEGARAAKGAVTGAVDALKGARAAKIAPEVSAAAGKWPGELHAAAEHEPAPEIHPDGVVGSEADPVERVDNALYRLGGHATAGRVEALQALKAVPKELKSAKVQEDLTHALEQKMVDPNADLPENLKAAEEVRAPWAERQRVAVNAVREKLAAKGLSDEEIGEYLPDTGYVPRRVQGKSPGFDPRDPETKRSPLAINQGGKRSLTKTTGSLKARDQIVLEDAQGNRVFEHRNKDNQEWRPGMQVAHPLTGKPVTVKQATIKEIEGAEAVDSKGVPLSYHKNALANTIDEALKAERVQRNLDVLDELTKGMKEAGLAHQDEWHRPVETAEGGKAWAKTRSNSQRPEGFVEVPHIPQLRGWSFDPKIAEVLKDYYPGPDEPVDSVLSKVNRMLNASLFITPIPHIKNILTMGTIARGFDNLRPDRYVKTALQAAHEVLTLGPKYKEFLREGSALQAGDEATRNFYQGLLESAGGEIERNPKTAAQIAKDFSVSPVTAVKALYSASHKFLWQANDMIMLQRQMELEAKGLARRDAIKEAERWIANYRVPPQVFKSRAFKQFLTNGQWVNFGRYTYGKWKPYGELYKSITKGSPEEKIDALGKILMAAILTAGVYPLMDKMVRKATGNPNAKIGMGGELSPVGAAQEALAGEKGWGGAMSSFLTPAPVIEPGVELLTDTVPFTGRKAVDPYASTKGKLVQGVEAAAQEFYPAQLGMDLAGPGGPSQAIGALAGINLPARAPGQSGMKSSTVKRLRTQAKSREKRDPIEGLIP